jgi:hypothetical protein
LLRVSLFMAVGAQPPWANLVANGDFDAVILGPPFVGGNPADIPDWTHTGSPGVGLLWAVGYADEGGSITIGPAGTPSS